MGAPRSRTPDEAGAREIAGALYPDLDGVEWIPSDDADVFRLRFTSGREPRILKMAAPGIRAVWREIGAFPAMRRLGIGEVLEFEHTSADLPDLGIEFHVTLELAHPRQANRAMAELWAGDRAGALEVAHWLGECTRRIESLDWRRVPRANSPDRSVAIGADWRKPQYRQLLARPDCPAWARTFIEDMAAMLGRPEAFDSFGGWAGELLRARDGRFVLIDWPGLGAAPRGSQAAAALEILLRFGAADPAPLVERFLAGWAPAGLDRCRLEDLRLWWAHGILWWAGLDLSLGADPDPDLTGVYAAARHCLENNDPASWLSPDTATAAPREGSRGLAGPGEHGISPPGPVAGAAVEGFACCPANVTVAGSGVPEGFGGACDQGGTDPFPRPGRRHADASDRSGGGTEEGCQHDLGARRVSVSLCWRNAAVSIC